MICHHSGYDYQSDRNLVRHMMTTHSQERFRCRRCRRDFNRRDKFQGHLNHHPVERFRCMRCPRIFTRRDNFQRHVNKHRVKKEAAAAVSLVDGNA
ncbi:hypothetical protein C8R43DRAFT_1028252 [Mycena crocata]|nr:hypothetical protein C8R43DRAFT_1028252 [Mycena crocata]